MRRHASFGEHRGFACQTRLDMSPEQVRDQHSERLGRHRDKTYGLLHVSPSIESFRSPAAKPTCGMPLHCGHGASTADLICPTRVGHIWVRRAHVEPSTTKRTRARRT